MDLETLYTSHDGFAIETATWLQRAKCRIIDGAPLNDLLARATEFDIRSLRAAIGCDPTNIPAEGPPTEVGDFAPVRCGKSVGFAALAMARSQTIDPSIVRPGEEAPRISILATQLDQAQAVRGHLNVLLERKKLKKYVIGSDDDSVTVKHPSGLPVQIRVIAAARGGYSIAARWAATVIFDEAPGWNSTDKIVSLEDSADQALSRLLPGAQIVYGGSVWQPSGKCFQMDREHFGKPTRDVVVMRPRLVDEVTPAQQLNPVYWTPDRVARMRKARGFRMHVLNEFGGASSVFDFDAVQRAFRNPSRARDWGRPVCIVDASSGKKDAWTFAICQWIDPMLKDEDILFEEVPGGMAMVVDSYDRPVAKPGASAARYLHFWKIDGFEGGFWEQVRADDIVARVSALCHRAGVRQVFGDQREAFALEADFRRCGLRFTEHPYTSGSKASAVERVRRWLRDGVVIFKEHDRLRSELINFVEKPTPGGGFTFGARGSGHDDYCCLVLTAALADMAGDIPRSPLAQNRGRGGMPAEGRVG